MGYGYSGKRAGTGGDDGLHIVSSRTIILAIAQNEGNEPLSPSIRTKLIPFLPYPSQPLSAFLFYTDPQSPSRLPNQLRSLHPPRLPKIRS